MDGKRGHVLDKVVSVYQFIDPPLFRFGILSRLMWGSILISIHGIYSYQFNIELSRDECWGTLNKADIIASKDDRENSRMGHNFTLYRVTIVDHTHRFPLRGCSSLGKTSNVSPQLVS